MSIHTSETYTFGNKLAFDFDQFSLHANPDGNLEILKDHPITPRVAIDDDRYRAALDDINTSLTTVEDPVSGKYFEIATANRNAPSDSADLELSTFTSSISKNIGNAIEFAEHSALHTERKRVYVASFGNGGSSYWDKNEQQYIRATGRFIQADGQPLPTIAALARVLRMTEERVISRISTNSAGGSYATALMGALPENQVTHAYLKSRPNISNHPCGVGWGLGLMLSEKLDNKRYQMNSADEWQLTAQHIASARQHLSNIYKDGHGEWSAKGAVNERGMGRLWSDMTALSRGGRAFGYPATYDTARAMKQQPNLKLTYHFPEKDRSYNNTRTDVAAFLSSLGLVIDRDQLPQIQALIMPGAHHDHSYYPALRWSIEKYALER